MRRSLVRLAALTVALAPLAPVGLPVHRASAVLGCTIGSTGPDSNLAADCETTVGTP